MYQERVGEETTSYKASSADRWSPDDEELLLCMLDNDATCLDMLRQFSHRRWMSIVKKLRRLRGNDVELPDDKRIRGTDMYADIVERYELEDEITSDVDAQVLSPVGRWWDVCPASEHQRIPDDG
jgi:hypothetical protein